MASYVNNYILSLRSWSTLYKVNVRAIELNPLNSVNTLGTDH